jgi:diguanylate cyclase (GGDEF)-like protein
VLALALLDIDHFKRINDSHGHDTGDAVLRRFAQAASARLRAGDALARWGGEEFLLVMPGATLAVGQQVLGRLRAAVQQTEFDAPVGPGGVTFSAGLVQCAVDESHDAAVARADRALYRAKAAGRDRCECDPSQAAAVHAAEPRPA